MNINYHEFGKRTQENLPKLTKNKNSNNSWNKPSKGQVEEKLIKSKVNKVLSFVGNLIENIFTNTSASVETYSCSYRIHDRRIYTLITH